MLIKKTRIIPERTSEYVEKIVCDMCGGEGMYEEWGDGVYEVEEVEIYTKVKYSSGNNWPEGGFTTNYVVDLCPICFQKRLIPWLKEQGCDVREEEVKLVI